MLHCFNLLWVCAAFRRSVLDSVLSDSKKMKCRLITESEEYKMVRCFSLRWVHAAPRRNVLLAMVIVLVDMGEHLQVR